MAKVLQQQPIARSKANVPREAKAAKLPSLPNAQFAKLERSRFQKFLSATKYYALGLFNIVGDDACFLYAAGIAFNVLLSIIPISLLLVETVSLLLQKSSSAASVLLRYLTASVPEAYKDYVSGRLFTLLDELTHISHWAGIIGAASLLWLGSALFSTLRTTLNMIFEMKAKSNSVLLKLLDLIMMVLIMALFVVVHFIWLIPRLVQTVGQQLFSPSVVTLMHSTLTKALSNVLPFAVLVFIYYLLFRVLPYQRLPRKVIFVATLTNVILLTLVKYVFAYYTLRLSSIGALYGAYALVFGAVLWLYYGCFVFTIGAEVGWLYWKRSGQLAKAKLKLESPAT